MKSIYLFLLLLFLFGCRSDDGASVEVKEGAPIISKEEDLALKARIEDNKPNLLSMQFTDDPELLVTYGFVMQGSWGENQQSTTMFITGDFDRKELAREDKDKVYKHLQGFYDLPNIQNFIDNTDSKSRQISGNLNLVTFNLHENEYVMYSFPKGHEDYKGWVSRFYGLYRNLLGEPQR